jgi:dynein intermediate chain 4, axonemal
MSGEGDGFADLLARPLDGAHTDAVWQLQWIEKSQGRGERLVSISADGRVKEWSTKKGLVCTGTYSLRSRGSVVCELIVVPIPVRSELMLLKRIRADGVEGTQEEKTDGVISRVDSGLCFDFPTNDPSIYYTGTEDGVVHHCSVSYGEQLESFRAHSGPVYRLKISPFLPQAVLTCSADWSVKLWDIGSGLQPCVFQTTDSLEAVMDVCWSKTHSTRFASVTGDGRIMLWDTSSFSPLIDHHVDESDSSAGVPAGSLSRKRRFTNVLFANDSPVLVTGDAAGFVDVYRVVGLPPPLPTVDDQVEALSKSLHPA